jgi:hypothetical protein
VHNTHPTNPNNGRSIGVRIHGFILSTQARHSATASKKKNADSWKWKSLGKKLKNVIPSRPYA